MIYVIATITVKPGTREAFLTHFNNNVPNVLAEEGCISYAPTTDVASGIPVQGALREDVVVVVEQWATLGHLHAHLKAPHMAEYRENVKDLVAALELQVLEPAQGA
jgi:quinol monooxygenase YgiN